MHKTITPKITETDTKYAYTTITNPKKGTSTTTTTVTKKISTSITTTYTATATTTTSVTSTSTVPAPAYFTPIQSSLPDSSLGPPVNVDGLNEKRSLNEALSKRDSPPAYYNGKSYPKSVMCHKYTTSKQCSTATVTKTKKTTAYPTTVHSTVCRSLVLQTNCEDVLIHICAADHFDHHLDCMPRCEDHSDIDLLYHKDKDRRSLLAERPSKHLN